VGAGTIDGQGDAWWETEGLQYGRPRLIEPMYCRNFSMIGVTVVDPPFWAMHPYACDALLFENITYSAPPNSPNTDGIDPDSCSNVVIRNFSTLHCGDDAIAIKSGKDAQGRAFGMPSYNILIEG
jgi:polygalacturonase